MGINQDDAEEFTLQAGISATGPCVWVICNHCSWTSETYESGTDASGLIADMIEHTYEGCK